MALYPISRRVSLFLPKDVAELVAAYARMFDDEALKEVLVAPLWINGPANGPSLKIQRHDGNGATVTFVRNDEVPFRFWLRIYELLVFADRAARANEILLPIGMREDIGDDAFILRAGRTLQDEIDMIAIAAPHSQKRRIC
jgi:hypothetical protein